MSMRPSFFSQLVELRNIWRNQKALPLLKVRTWKDEVSERLEEYLRIHELKKPEKDAVQNKKAVSQFRDLWNSPSVISPSKQSHDSVALELVMINAYKFSINLGKIGAFDQLGGTYGSFLPPYVSSTVLSRVSTEKKVQSLAWEIKSSIKLRAIWSGLI